MKKYLFSFLAIGLFLINYSASAQTASDITQMIEQHYGHVKLDMMADELTKRTRK